MNEHKLIVFDLDRTLIAKNSSYLLGAHLYKTGRIPLRRVLRVVLPYVRHRFLGLRLREYHAQLFTRILQGLSLEELQGELPSFVQGVWFSNLYPPVFSLFKRAQHLGVQTALLSSGPDFLVERMAQLLGFDFWHGTKYLMDEKGRLAGIGDVMDGARKREVLEGLRRQLGLLREQVAVYSDSHDDLDLFLAAGTAVAVNPTVALRRIAQNKGWLVIG